MANFDTASSTSDSDESAELKNLIASYSKGMEREEGELHVDDATNARRKHNIRKKKKTKKPKHDHLKHRISDLMTIFEGHGLFIPPAESMGEKGKVWSSRIYGADKKRQRKNTERLLLEDRIEQLEYCLQETHGISA